MPRAQLQPARAASAVGLAVIIREPEQLRLFDAGVDLAALRKERAAISARRRSANTQRAYAADWRDWERWCSLAGRAPLPASPDTLSLYLVDLARCGRLPATIARRVAAISERHLAAGLASPATPDVGEVLAGIRRKLGAAPRRAKAALSADELRLVVGGLARDVRGLRDRALLLLGFAGGFRRSELAALQLGDVTVEREGLVVRLRSSKTDQEGRGRELGIHRGRRVATCPVRAVVAWIGERGGWPGALFCRVAPSGAIERRSVQGAAVAAVVKAAVARAGLDPARYSGHSLRAGCATAAAAGGAGELAIKGRTGHKSTAMVERYVRHGSLFAVDPLRGVL